MFSILRFRQGCLYFHFYSSVWVSSVFQRGLVLGALKGVTITRQLGRRCEKEIPHHFSPPFPNMSLFWMTCFYFICCLLDPSKKEGSSSFLRALTLPPATHSFTNLHYIPWQSACSQGHSPWKSAGYVFLVVILVLLSLISKDFLFTMFKEHKAAVLFIGMFICHLPTIFKAKL